MAAAGVSEGSLGTTPGGASILQADEAPVESFVWQEIFKGEDVKGAFVTFLQKEIDAAINDADRAKQIERVRKWRRQREARPENETKDFPFPNSANVSPPLMLTRGNTIFAKLMANYSTKRPFWSGDADDPAYAPHAAVWAKVLNYYSKSKFHIDIKKANRQIFYDLVFEGTKFVRVGWDMQRFKAGGADNSVRFKRNSPALWPIRLEDFVTRTYWTDVQDMPWCGARVVMSYREMLDAQAQGRFQNVELIAGAAKSTFLTGEQLEMERRGITPEIQTEVDATKFFDLYELYCFWDVDGDGLLEDVHCVLEPQTGTILRATINETGWRLFARIPYIDVPGQLYGIGVGHLLELLQDEADTYRNMRLDAIKIAMLPMFKARRGAGLKLGEKAEPWKIWWLDQLDDFLPMVLPDVSQVTLPGESVVGRDADQASGANEAMGGFADSTMKSGGGAEAQQIMMEQGFSVLNSNLEGVDDSYCELGRMLVLVMHQNAALLDLSFLTPDEQTLMGEVFALPIEELPARFRFNIETTDLARNEKSQRENFMAFSGLYSQYVGEVTQFMLGLQQAMASGNPVLVDLMQKCIVGKTTVMERMIEFLHIGDPKKYLPDVTAFQGGPNGTPEGAPTPGAIAGGAAPGSPAGAGGMGGPGPGGPQALGGGVGAGGGPMAGGPGPGFGAGGPVPGAGGFGGM